jgi:hypothetical protein
VQLRGVELNEKNFVAALYEIAERGDSFEYADALGAALREGDPLKSPIVELLGNFLSSGPPRQAEFAAKVHNLHGVLPAAKLSEALARQELDAIPKLRLMIATDLSLCIQKGELAYSKTLRRFAGDVSIDGWLTACYVIFDHEWFLANLKLVLSDDPDKADGRLALVGDTKAELLRLRDELRERRAQIGDQTLRLYEERLAEVLPRFADTPDTIRWRTT